MAAKTWDEYHADVERLMDAMADYRPDVIVPCMLGGLFPGMIIAKRLGVKDVRPIDIERDGYDRRLAYDVQGDIEGKKVLIVEDDIPTGKGPAMVKDMFEKRGADVRIAAVYVTQESRQVADYYAEVFPGAAELPDYPYKKHNIGDRLRR